MIDHLKIIDDALEKSLPYNEIARKVFLGYPTSVFEGQEERQYEILNKISTHFGISYTSVQVAGSAKTGKSFHQNRTFILGESDLDIAIIDSGLFSKYMELVFKVTKGYQDRSGFPILDGVSRFKEYRAYLSKGIFRPDLMPACPQRADWRNFFGQLSAGHTDLFKSINAGIYASQCFFEYKQKACISAHKEQKAI